jgi:hypothetical protein
MFYSIAHAHLYENQTLAARILISSDIDSKAFPLKLKYDVQDIIDNRDAYVESIVKVQKSYNYEPANVTKGLLPKVVL